MDNIHVPVVGTVSGLDMANAVNAGFDSLQKNIGAALSKSVAGGVDVMLSAAEANNAIITLTGLLTANINVIVPTSSFKWKINNQTTGAYALTVKTAAGTGVQLLQGFGYELYCDGTNVLTTNVSQIPVTTAGTSTAFTLTPNPAIPANATYQRFRVKFHTAAGATPTMAISGQAALNLKYKDATGTKQAITSAQVPANWIADVENDGTDFVVLQPCGAVVLDATGKLPALDGSQLTGISSGDFAVQDFRLSLTSGTPVTTSDVTGATTIYCTPFKGKSIGLYTGSAWVIRQSAEFSLALGTLTSGKPYDVFCYDNAGTPTLEFLAWTNDTTRATALAYQDGVLVKSGAATRRYLGTFYTTATTTTEDSAAKRLLWNYYNRVLRPMARMEATVSWTYSTATLRQANGSSLNQLEFITGVQEDQVKASCYGEVISSTATYRVVSVEIGVDSTTVASAQICQSSHVNNTAVFQQSASYQGSFLGHHYLAWLEKGNGNDTQTWYGNSSPYKTGIIGEVWA